MDQHEKDAPVPRASYRLQLNKDFTFADVERIAPYLGRLGVSHAYLSPILRARAGSTHGYDTVDHTEINPELGTIEDFRRMAQRLRDEGVGIILDIVPNHMGVGGADNPYWLDLLEWGRDSEYADWFDVNWNPAEPSLQDKVLVPFLGCGFGEAVETGRLKLKYDAEAGSFAAWAEDNHKLPIDPRTYADILGRGGDAQKTLARRFAAIDGPGDDKALKAELAAAPKADIDALVDTFNSKDARDLFERQNWRAARYSVAADDINYRRFFIVSDLGAVRIDRDEVFDHAHRLIFQLVEEGWIDGLRIDHIDGLYDPKQYALRLREKCPRPIYLVVEKILAPGETVRPDWRVDGTTGYEFANAVVQLLVEPRAETALTHFYAEFTGNREPFVEIERYAKLEIVDYEMSAELDALTVRLSALAGVAPETGDLTYNGLRNGLRHFVASMSVYRTYVDAYLSRPADIAEIDKALSVAREMAPTLDPAIFDFLRAVATGELAKDERYEAADVIETSMRLQQFTGPVMAKGLEDTTLYRYNRLIALNDVGQLPDRFSSSAEGFHAFNSQRADTMPNGMLTSSSHDTKRGEDVRARIAALTELPDEWQSLVRDVRQALGDDIVGDFSANDLYYFTQQVLGAWPAELLGDDVSENALDDFRERSIAALTKAVREARVRTNWTAPNEAYETRLKAIVETALDAKGEVFAVLHSFAGRLARLGARNGLVAATLKLTSPGMPDIYQGAELHELSMVDPDNRRPVDFEAREALLEKDAALDFETGWISGETKLGVIRRLLELRKQEPELFASGLYEPVPLTGDASGRSLAFLRRSGEDVLLVIAWLGSETKLADARLELPADLGRARWRSILSDGDVDRFSQLDAVLGPLPVAVLHAKNT